MKLGSYFRQGICDMLLCVIASSALIYTLSAGFYAAEVLASNLALVVVPALVLTLVLYAISYSSRSALYGGIVLAIAVVAIFMASVSIQGSALFSDEAGSVGVFLVIEIAVSILVFVLSRKRVTCIILLIGGILLGCVIEFLYWEFHALAFVLFALSAAGLLAIKGYQGNLMSGTTTKVSFPAVTVAAVAMTAVAACLACGIFYVFVAPNDPGRLELILNTEYLSLEDQEVRGVGSTYDEQNPDMLSATSNGLLIASSNAEDSEENTETTMESTAQDDLADQLSQAGAALSIDYTTDEEAATPITMEQLQLIAIIVAIVIALLLICLVVGKKVSRRMWFNKLCKSDGKQQVKSLYALFIKDLSKFGIKKIPSATFTEFAEQSKGATAIYSLDTGGITIPDLTRTYYKVVYGDVEPEEEELSAFKGFYRRFYRNARRHVGPFVYLRKFLFV